MTDYASDAARRISICYVYSVIDNELAGTERHLLQLIPALDRREFDPLFVVLQESDYTRRTKSTVVLPLHVLGFRSLLRPEGWWRVVQLARVLRQHRTKIVEVHSPEGQMMGVLAAKLARVPVILAGRRNSGYSYGMKERWQTRWSNRFVAKFLANSQHVVQELNRIEGIPSARFHVIHNGIDLPSFDAAKSQAVDRRFTEFCRDAIVVCMAANLRPIKNHAMLLRAARRVVAKHPQTRFALLGSGSEEVRLRQMAAELKVSDHFYFAGSVAPVAAYLARSHIGVLTSDSEGFSTAIVESMAAGLPVVATQVGGAREVITSGENGMLIPVGDEERSADELGRLIANPQRRQTMGVAARQAIEASFDWSQQRMRYEDFYRAVLQRRR